MAQKASLVALQQTVLKFFTCIPHFQDKVVPVSAPFRRTSAKLALIPDGIGNPTIFWIVLSHG
jgi:hypothetical protein